MAFISQWPRLVLLTFLALLPLAAHGAEPPAWPLWDGQETVADYAKRANLPPTKTLELGGNVKLELVLIPAGEFIMGTPEPVPVDEDGFRKKIITGQAFLTAGVGALLVMLPPRPRLWFSGGGGDMHLPAGGTLEGLDMPRANSKVG